MHTDARIALAVLLLLKALGLKSVDAAKVCIDPDMARAYEIIVRKATREHDLIWDDAE